MGRLEETEARGRAAGGPGDVQGSVTLWWTAGAPGQDGLVPGDSPELDPGAGAALGVSSTTENTFWRLMVSSSW